MPKPLIPSTTKPASLAQLRITDSGKGKGKVRPSPELYVEDVTMGTPSKFDVAAAYEWHALYKDDNWSDNDVVRADAGDILKVPTSKFGHTVHVILQGLHINSKVASCGGEGTCPLGNQPGGISVRHTSTQKSTQ